MELSSSIGGVDVPGVQAPPFRPADEEEEEDGGEGEGGRYGKEVAAVVVEVEISMWTVLVSGLVPSKGGEGMSEESIIIILADLTRGISTEKLCTIDCVLVDVALTVPISS